MNDELTCRVDMLGFLVRWIDVMLMLEEAMIIIIMVILMAPQQNHAFTVLVIMRLSPPILPFLAGMMF